MNVRRLILTLCLALLAWGSSSLAQEDAPGQEDPGSLHGTEQLNRSLEDIARSLREIVAFRKIDLLIRRIDLEERRLYPLGQELRSARNQAAGREEEIARLRQMEDSVRDQAARAVRGGADPQQIPQRYELERIEAAIEVETEQLEVVEHRVVVLESDLLHGRGKIDQLEERLEELLAETGQ